MRKEIFVFLDNIRSAHNVGSIFRTSDGAGVSKIFLSGFTPDPIDRFGRVQSEIAKTSLGASEVIDWQHVPIEQRQKMLLTLQNEGFYIVAVEQSPKSISLEKYTPLNQKICYVFGSETDGVAEEIVQLADAVLEIPMHGMKESLNVSVSAGIVLYKQ